MAPLDHVAYSNVVSLKKGTVYKSEHQNRGWMLTQVLLNNFLRSCHTVAILMSMGRV